MSFEATFAFAVAAGRQFTPSREAQVAIGLFVAAVAVAFQEITFVAFSWFSSLDICCC